MNTTSAVILSLGLIISSCILTFSPHAKQATEQVTHDIVRGKIKRILIWQHPIGSSTNNSGFHINEGDILINYTKSIVVITNQEGESQIVPLNRVEIKNIKIINDKKD